MEECEYLISTKFSHNGNIETVEHRSRNSVVIQGSDRCYKRRAASSTHPRALIYAVQRSILYISLHVPCEQSLFRGSARMMRTQTRVAGVSAECDGVGTGQGFSPSLSLPLSRYLSRFLCELKKLKEVYKFWRVRRNVGALTFPIYKFNCLFRFSVSQFDFQVRHSISWNKRSFFKFDIYINSFSDFKG